MKRAHLSLKTRLASALLAIKAFELGRWSPLIPHEDAKQMTADQIISLYAFDHYPIRKADGGPDEPWNLEPRLIVAHRAKTAKVDVPEMAKSKRIRRELKKEQVKAVIEMMGTPFDDYCAFAKSLGLSEQYEAARSLQRDDRKRRIPSRPFPKIKRRIANKRGNKI